MSGSPLFKTRPIDDAARNGLYQMVLGGSGRFALVRWDGFGWVFSSGHTLHWIPAEYRPSAPQVSFSA